MRRCSLLHLSLSLLCPPRCSSQRLLVAHLAVFFRLFFILFVLNDFVWVRFSDLLACILVLTLFIHLLVITIAPSPSSARSSSISASFQQMIPWHMNVTPQRMTITSGIVFKYGTRVVSLPSRKPNTTNASVEAARTQQSSQKHKRGKRCGTWI